MNKAHLFSILALAVATGCKPATPGYEASSGSSSAPNFNQAFVGTQKHERQQVPASVTVDELMKKLNEVHPTMSANPGGVSFVGDPIYEAIYAKGDAAIEPLLKAYGSDDRPTGDGYPTHTLGEKLQPILAKEIAHAALIRILDASDLFSANYGHPGTPDEIRAYWNSVRNLSPAERHLKVLEDDKAEPQNWVGAAQRLTDPIGSLRSSNGWYSASQTKPGAPQPPMLGESLRARTHPSVTEILIHRTRELAGLEPDPNSDPRTTGFGHMYSEQLADILAKWDPKAALPTLQAISRSGLQSDPRQNYGETGYGKTKLIEARVAQGDTTALKEYADWIVPIAADPKQMFFPAAPWFEPFAAHPDDPAIQAAAKAIVANPNSPWNARNLAKRGRPFIASPILAFPDFYAVVLSKLDDDTPNGRAFRQGANVSIQSGGAQWSAQIDKAMLDDPQTLKDHDSFDVRVCDTIAMELSHMEGAPKLLAYRPVAERDRTIKELKAFLKKNQGHLVELLDWPNSWKQTPDFARMKREQAAHR